MIRARSLLVGLLLAACAGAPGWQADLPSALAQARAARRELVVCFVQPGREQSDRLQQQLSAPPVRDALRAGDFAAVVGDGTRYERLYDQWIGYGRGFGLAVLSGQGHVVAARPGGGSADELAAFLRQCIAARAELELAEPFARGRLLAELGCRVRAEPLLLDAAIAGNAEARHLLARLYAEGGNTKAARRWLQNAPRSPAAQVTEGFLLVCEQRPADAVAALEGALAQTLDDRDRQFAQLWLGRALRAGREHERARAVLAALVREGTGSVYEAEAAQVLREPRAVGEPPR